MDREGPDETTPGRGGGHELRGEPHPPGDARAGDAVAASTSSRVGEVLAKAEDEAAAIAEQAERQAEGIAEAARAEAIGIGQGAHGAAQAAARERADRLSELRSSIAARCASLTEGLEGGELTRLRLEQLVGMLGEAEEHILREVAIGPHGERHVPPPPAPPPVVPAAGDGSVPDDAGELPEGAPMVRMPARSGNQASDARFAAVLMAIDGGERGDIEDHLGSEYGKDGWDELLDELFGRTDVRA